jgi:hypothetical protein
MPAAAALNPSGVGGSKAGRGNLPRFEPATMPGEIDMETANSRYIITSRTGSVDAWAVGGIFNSASPERLRCHLCK